MNKHGCNALIRCVLGQFPTTALSKFRIHPFSWHPFYGRKSHLPLACGKCWWWSDGQFSGRNNVSKFSSGCDETWRWTGWERVTSVWHWNNDWQQQRGEVLKSDSKEIIASTRLLSNWLWVSTRLPAPLINMPSAWVRVLSAFVICSLKK